MFITYEGMAIDWILNIDIWKNQWLLSLTLKAIPCRIFLFS